MTVRCAREDDVDLERDRVLVERCQAGDSRAFDLLYQRYFERLKRFCLRRIGDRDEAEDVAQEAFARAWKALPAFSGEKRFYPWLSVIAGNLCTDTLRKRSRNTPVPDQELDWAGAAAGTRAAAEEDRIFEAVDADLAAQALNRISPRHREVLIQRETQEWTYQQIADFHGVRITTVEALIWRARRSLRREFMVLSGAESLGVVAGISLAWRRFVQRTTQLARRSSTHGKVMPHGAGTPVTAAAAHAIPAGLIPLVGAIAAAGTSVALLISGTSGGVATGLAASGVPAASSSPSGIGSLASVPAGAAWGAAGGTGTGRSGSGSANTAGASSGGTGSLGSGSLASLPGTATGKAGSVLPGSGELFHSVLGAFGGSGSSTSSAGAGGAAGAVSSATGSVSQAVTGATGALSSALSGIISGVTSTASTLPSLPVTVPPVTVPPVAVPPATAPPVTAPPVTVPPATAPPVTAPPVTSTTVTAPASYPVVTVLPGI